MTPSLFAGTDARDEYEFMQTPGALAKLREHQKTFITEEDFRWMSKNGINAVRIPVGYWIINGDGPFRSSIGKLDWAVRTAKQYDIAVLICLHGAPGSQNGNDHSGQAGKADWYERQTYRTQTVQVLSELAKRYAAEPAVWGIELLNEPLAKFWQPTLRRFYRDAYAAIRQVARPGLTIVYSDAFTPRLLSGALTPKSSYPIVMDHHWYHFFIPGWLQPKLPFGWYYTYLRYKSLLVERLSRAQPVIIGEWSGIIGGEKLSKYPERAHEALIDTHIQKQLTAYEHLAGWFYWSYKTEDRGVFHFRSMVEDGRVELSTEPRHARSR
jgi:glucan 1,3-beta-glucosidase